MDVTKVYDHQPQLFLRGNSKKTKAWLYKSKAHW